MAHLYKNTSDQEQTVPGAGVWKAGETKESPIEINNANFEKVAAGTQPSTPTVTTAAETHQTQEKKSEPFAPKEGDK